MSQNKIIGTIVFIAGLIFGILFFIPIDPIRARVLSYVSRQSDIEITIKKLGLGTGLGLGISDGSLFALRGKDALIGFQNGQMLRCSKLIIAPKILPILVGRFSGTLYCEMGASGTVTAGISGSPFWNPKTLNLSVEVEELDMAILEQFTQVSPFAGTLNGTVELKEVNPSSSRMPDAEWNLDGKEVMLPAVTQDFFNLPSLQIGPMSTKGTIQNSKLKIDEIKFGKADTMIEGTLTANLGLSSSGVPSNGEITGKLRTDPDFEKSQLTDINLDLAFGKVKPSGFREFRKKMEGGPQSLLMNPPLDN